MRVVVVGGGLGGLASAARLAKLGHQVTLLERGPRLGGALRPVEHGDYRWDASATTTLLPAVLRDLFRKSGRPLDAELSLVDVPILREHRFADGSAVRVPGGSRAAQLEAFDHLGPGLGQAWVDHVSSWSQDWELLRRDYLERPWSPEVSSRELTRVLLTRENLRRRLRRSLSDPRLRLVASHDVDFGGHDPRNVPAWMGLVSYLEQTFGGWRPVGGMGSLVDALERRLATRRVDVETGVSVEDVVLREGRPVAVATTAGSVDADAVVVAIDPRRIPALAGHVSRTMPAIPPTTLHLGLRGDLPDLPAEVVFHGDPTLVLRTTGESSADGARAWTLHGRGKLAEPMLDALARHGLDLRDRVDVAIERSPRDLVEEWGGSPSGVLWQGRATVQRRLGPTTPVPGVFAAGAHATPGTSIPFVGLSAALVARSIGPA